MSNRTIYDALIAAGLTQEGACGLMGNMMAESTMKSNIAQRGMTSLSDEAYTEAADGGVIDFANDAVGYGLCQWTFSPRKADLLDYSKSMGVSVGNEAMQVQFCLRELQQDFPFVLMTLRSSNSLWDCTRVVCEKYENPAVWNTNARFQYAQQFFNEFAGSNALAAEHAQLVTDTNVGHTAEAAQDVCPVFPPDPSVLVIQMVMAYNGYWDKPDGYKTAEFFAALRTFTDDMEKC